MSGKTLLTTGDVARHCQVTQRTVHNWIQGGHLATARTPGGHQRIRVVDFQRFLQAHRLPGYGADPEGPAAPDAAGECRVLIVDDEPQVRIVIARALERAGGYRLATAGDGFTAGLEVGRFRPHVVIMDILMPHLDGLEACRWIRQDPQAAGTRILVVSALDPAGLTDRVGDLALDGWLQKPIRMQDLVDEVARLAPATRAAT